MHVSAFPTATELRYSLPPRYVQFCPLCIIYVVNDAFWFSSRLLVCLMSFSFYCRLKTINILYLYLYKQCLVS